MPGCRLISDLTYKGLDTLVLENQHVRITVLVGKGGDIIEYRDKRTDINPLFTSDHRWRSPTETYVPSTGDAWMDYYPGGWQDVLPMPGPDVEVNGATFALHGESALTPWEAAVLEDSSSSVTVELSVELTRYPFAISRELTLREGEPLLDVTETVSNLSSRPLEYAWVQHLVLGRPLITPGTTLHIPASSAISADPPISGNSRLPGGQRFDWPELTDGDFDIDMSVVPEGPVHDVAYVDGLDEGWFGVHNEEIDLGFGMTFDNDLFECLWLWQAFGGHELAPYFNRSWNLGVEPATAYPETDLPNAARDNGTIDVLGGGGEITTEYRTLTYRSHEEFVDRAL